MDIHRSRFVAFPSSAINALSFSRSSDKNLTDPRPALKLALGRANGDIEIWSADKGNWVQESVFTGGNKRSVDALAWIQEPDDTDYEGHTILGQLRLFSIGSTAAVTEWDLTTGKELRSSTGNFSEVWCFAAQPRWRQTKTSRDDEFRGQNLVAGTGDGTLAILSTEDNDLVFKRFLARGGSRKTRCMSVTWKDRDTVVAGFTDSTIRIYDARNGSLLRNLSLGAGVPGAPRDILVWKVKCLPNGDIVSGDSNGQLKFWDGRTYTLSQSVHGHDSDCLDLVSSTDGTTVFSGGMDGRIAVFKLGGKEGDKRRWAKTSHRRMHEGDIKAMAVYDSKHMSVVLSGGLDTTPFVIPLRNFNKENHRRLPGLPQNPVLASCPQQRVLVSWAESTINIWRMYKQNHERIPVPEGTRKLLTRIRIDSTETITSVAISPDASLLAASTTSSVKLFHLSRTEDESSERLRVRKIAAPETIGESGARLITFSPDGRWLAAVTPQSEVCLARVEDDSDKPTFLDANVELERQTRKVTIQTGLKKYERTINRLAFSPDSAVLVASDLSGYLDSWVLEGRYDSTAPAMDTTTKSASGSDKGADSDDSDSDDEDETTVFYGQHWTDNPSGSLLPKLDSAPLVLSFQPLTPAQQEEPTVNGNPGVHPTRNNPHPHSHALPSTKSPLFIVTSHHQVYTFDVLSGRLTDWSRRNPTAVLPAEFQTIKDRAMGVVWDVNDARARAWLYGANWVGMLDLSQDYEPSSVLEEALEDGEDDVAAQNTPSKKRKRRESNKWGKLAENRKKAKGMGGAGDKTASGETKGVVDEIRRIVDGKAVETIDGTHEQDLDDEDALEDAVGPLRRDDAEADMNEGTNGALATTGRRKWWCTYRYRPILGMVAMGEASEADEQPEAVLVERPLWDLPQLQELSK
ncbi:WD40 repeat-like protein [Aureobasidium pullulans EXF-150]|uniref:WD40 repeat-like protein n=1 Tax=Aureobasidium pullulans EXF-150 TaxID=1043002 RepID=A0A074XN86_AURPU|nr:WD40 repeat-like protein [Aureobasidium pullulans EXF-150]KEQ86990.1 WD40 repeat-like protein [Aureobasidium pullulans EXF-150]